MYDPSGGGPAPAANLRPDWAAMRPASWRTKLLYAGPLALMVAPFLPWVRAQIFIATFTVNAMDIGHYGQGILAAAVLMLVLGHAHASGVRAAKGLLVGVSVVAVLLFLASYSDAHNAIREAQGEGLPISLGFGFYLAGIAAATTLYGAVTKGAGPLSWAPAAGDSLFTKWAPRQQHWSPQPQAPQQPWSPQPQPQQPAQPQPQPQQQWSAPPPQWSQPSSPAQPPQWPATPPPADVAGGPGAGPEAGHPGA